MDSACRADLLSYGRNPTRIHTLTFPHNTNTLTKRPLLMSGLFVSVIENLMLAPTYSAPEGVPSAMESLTAVFGMRTGGPSPLKHQHSTLNYILTLTSCEMSHSENRMVPGHGIEPWIALINRTEGQVFLPRPCVTTKFSIDVARGHYDCVLYRWATKLISHDIRLAYSNYLVPEGTVDIYTNITSQNCSALFLAFSVRH